MTGLDPAGTIWGTLQWQAAPDLEEDYAVSIRLYNDEGTAVFQEDTVLWNPANHTPTSLWPAQ